MSSVTKLRRVLKHIVTGEIPGIVQTPEQTPEVKQEPDVKVVELLKQEKPQEVSKMSDEEHNEQELKNDDDEKPKCYGEYDPEAGDCETCEFTRACEDDTPDCIRTYDPEDKEKNCKNCDVVRDCESETPEDEGEESKDSSEDKQSKKKSEEAASSEVESEKPAKYTITKMMRSRSVKEDGTVDNKLMPRTVGDTYIGEPPGKEEIEPLLVPIYGGGEYIVINQTTHKTHKRYNFPGAAKDPDEPEPTPVAPLPTTLAGAFRGLGGPLPSVPQEVSPGIAQENLFADRMKAATAVGSLKAADNLTAMAMEFAGRGDIDKFNRVMDTLTAGLSGQKPTSPNDRLTDMLMEDRKMMMQMLIDKGKGKETSSSDIVRETMSTMKEMFGLAKEFAPQGEDTGVQMVREVSGVVKDSLKDVTDTVIQVTGSRPLKQVEETPQEKIVYKCERCGHVVEPRWTNCPYCGVKFTGQVSTPKPLPPVVIGQTAPVETFRKPIPPLPPEVKERMEYLKKVAVFIQESHDPVVKGSAAFKVADPEQKVALLFTANFGYGNIMKLAQPWRHSTEIPEGETIFKVIESANGRLWINKFFASIRETAKADGFILDQGTIDHYLEEINKYSVVKFSFRPKPGPEGPAKATAPPELKQVKGKTVAMSECPVCHEAVPTMELKDHLFKQHPPIKITNPRAIAAIQKGAAVLPRGREEVVTEPPPNSHLEPLVPNGNGAEEDGT